MTQCCTSSKTKQSHTKKYRCPVNGKQYAAVSSTTISHHILEPWKWLHTKQNYYFCDDPECDVVYFGQDDTTICRSSLRTKVGIKEKTGSSLVCYCFGVTKNNASNKNIKDFVIKNTKEHTCTCDTRNPSGHCCLKDFPWSDKRQAAQRCANSGKSLCLASYINKMVQPCHF